MIRAYFAVVKDAFREAVHSRVLWLMFLLWTVLLLALAPLGVGRRVTWRLQETDVQPALLLELYAAGRDEAPSPGRRVWSLLDRPLKERIQRFIDRADLFDEQWQEQAGAGAAIDAAALLRLTELGVELRREAMELTRLLVEQLNALLARDDLYDEAAWAGLPQPRELRELLDAPAGRLTADEAARANRLLLESAFPHGVSASPRSSIQYYVLGREIGAPMPMDMEAFETSLALLVTYFLDWFVGGLGVLVAVLVTARNVPRMLEPGSIELLLSKPISRVGLLLAEFLGACAFILLNVTYFLGGLWLLLGLRFGMWNPRLLLAIPLFLLLFAIYYCVSMAAGLAYRNAIVSIVLTFIFWAACYAVSLAQWSMEGVLLKPRRIVALVPAEEALFSVNELGEVQRWDETEQKWQRAVWIHELPGVPLFAPPATVGPAYDAVRKELLLLQPPAPQLWVLPAERQWRREPGDLMPPGTRALAFDPQGALLAVAVDGIYRRRGDPAAPRDPAAALLPAAGGADAMENVGPHPPMTLLSPLSAAVHPASGAIAVYSRGQLVLLAPDAQGQYQRRQEVELGEADQPALLAMAGDVLLAARSDGTVEIRDARTLALRRTFRPEGNVPPRSVTAAPGGNRFAVVFHNQRLWLYDAAAQAEDRAAVRGQGGITAAAFAGDDHLLVSDRPQRVRRYRLHPRRLEEQYAPPLGAVEMVYEYGIRPLHVVLPKPAEMNQALQYLATEKRTIGLQTQELGAMQEKLHPWRPVVSGVLFVLVMLTAASVYFHRADL